MDEARLHSTVDRRSEPRHLHFAPIILELSHDLGHTVQGFTQNVSPSGVGLLLSEALEPGQVVIATINGPHQESVRVMVQIVWCRPCGAEGFLTGAVLLPEDHR